MEEIIDIIDNIGEEPEITKITDPNIKIAEKQNELFQNDDAHNKPIAEKNKGKNFCTLL